jgi:TonB family protein
MSNLPLALAALLILPTASASAVSSGGNSSSSSLLAQNYPRESLARGEQGVVGFKVELDKEANVESCVVNKSSGYPRLDIATCDLLVRHASFAPAVAGGQQIATIRTGEVKWRLPAAYRQNASFAPAPVAVTLAQLEAQRLICKRSQGTGSIVKLKTYCLTRVEWDQARENGQRETKVMTSPYASIHGCGRPGC